MQALMRIDISLRQKAQVAQSVEQRTENPRVDSSILSLGTIYQADYNNPIHGVFLFFGLIAQPKNSMKEPWALFF
jgi:hypothetical protein